MDSVLRGIVVYFVLLMIIRLAGRRTIAQMTPFDLILVLIISETVQQALVDGDNSMINGGLLVLTLVGCAILMSVLKQRSKTLQRWIDGLPVFAIEKGKLHEDRLNAMRVDRDDIMSAARDKQGVRTLDDIEHAVVENSGHITIIPKQNQA
jgi:uncharacterized membrane protein YcaP (DUF421 family)